MTDRREVQCPECLGAGGAWSEAINEGDTDPDIPCEHCAGIGAILVSRPQIEKAPDEPWVFRAAPQVRHVEAGDGALSMRIYVDLGFRIMHELFVVVPLALAHEPHIVVKFTESWCSWAAPDPLYVTTFEQVDPFWIVNIERIERDDEGKPIGKRSLADALIEQGLCRRVEGADVN